MANAACVALDFISSHNAAGMIAGDDTIFVAFKTITDAEEYADELRSSLQ